MMPSRLASTPTSTPGTAKAAPGGTGIPPEAPPPQEPSIALQETQERGDSEEQGR